MNGKKAMMMCAGCLLIVSVCSAAGKQEKEGPAPGQPAPQGVLFATNMPAGQTKAAPFSSEISADFIKKVMETSARIEACKKKIADRRVYLYEHNPEIKACRQEMTAMQTKINKLLETDQELAELRMNRDMLWTTMPVLPKPPEQHMAPRQMGLPSGRMGK